MKSPRPFETVVLLLLDDLTVAAANFAPAAIEIAARALIGVREFGGRLLIDLDTPARLGAGPDVPVFEDRHAVEDLARVGVKFRVLLDAEVVAHNVESHVGHVADRRNVSGTMPCRFHTEQ